MKPILSWFVVFLTVALLVPTPSGAQGPTTAPVPSYMQECDPKAANPDGPKTGDAVTRMVMFGHFADGLNQAPLNTQAPDPDCTPDITWGSLMPTVHTAGLDAGPHFKGDGFTMFSSAGLVEYNKATCERRVHEEAGTAEDFTIVGENVLLYFYLSAHAVPGQAGGTQPLGVAPHIGIKARMETGRSYGFGETIAQGDTGKDDVGGLAGGSGRANIISTPTGDVYELVVPMKVENKLLRSIHNTEDQRLWGFIVTAVPYQIMVKEGPGKDSQVAQSDWRFRASADFPPRIVFDVDKAMQTKIADHAVPLSTFRDNLFIRWSFVSPFGSSDIDDASLKVSVAGPTEIDPKLFQLYLKRSINHDGHFLPVNATWKFDYPKAGLADGEYSIDMSVMNLQGTYRLEHSMAFKVQGGQFIDVPAIGGVKAKAADGGSSPQTAKGQSPGAEIALMAVGLLAAAWLRRREA